MTPGLLSSRRGIMRDIVGPRGAFSSLQCLECWGEWCRCKTNHLSPLSKHAHNISNDQKILNSAGHTHSIPNETSNLKQCGLYRFVSSLFSTWGIHETKRWFYPTWNLAKSARTMVSADVQKRQHSFPAKILQFSTAWTEQLFQNLYLSSSGFHEGYMGSFQMKDPQVTMGFNMFQ